MVGVSENAEALLGGEVLPQAAGRRLRGCDAGHEMVIHHQLIVVGAVIEAERVCIVFTCPEMLDRAKAAENKFIKLVLDGKQKVVTNDYTIVTVSFCKLEEQPNEAAE